MAAKQTLAATILNDAAKEHKLEQDRKRELDNKHKWASGEAAPRPGRLSKRPQKGSPLAWNRIDSREAEFQANKAAKSAKIARKHESLHDNDITVSDSSAEEDVKEASAAPVPDAGITYSYDAPRGPGGGSQILNMALAKAVEKFEVKATEKLIKEEYEVVRKDNGTTNDGYSADDDDFELI